MVLLDWEKAFDKVSHEGLFNALERMGVDEQILNIIKKILQIFSERLPRKPWEYTITQKLRNGWFSQGIMGAKKSWHKVIG